MVRAERRFDIHGPDDMRVRVRPAPVVEVLFAALLYTGMTVDSVRRHAGGHGGSSKRHRSRRGRIESLAERRALAYRVSYVMTPLLSTM
jgi:hypothetical protein